MMRNTRFHKAKIGWRRMEVESKEKSYKQGMVIIFRKSRESETKVNWAILLICSGRQVLRRQRRFWIP
jgi:hypothetical protein